MSWLSFIQIWIDDIGIASQITPSHFPVFHLATETVKDLILHLSSLNTFSLLLFFSLICGESKYPGFFFLFHYNDWVLPLILCKINKKGRKKVNLS